MAKIKFIRKGNSIQDDIYLSMYYEHEITHIRCISMWLISVLFVLCLVDMYVLTSLRSIKADMCITVVYLLSLTSCLCLLFIYDNYIIHIVVGFCFYFFCIFEVLKIYCPYTKIFKWKQTFLGKCWGGLGFTQKKLKYTPWRRNHGVVYSHTHKHNCFFFVVSTFAGIHL